MGKHRLRDDRQALPGHPGDSFPYGQVPCVKYIQLALFQGLSGNPEHRRNSRKLEGLPKTWMTLGLPTCSFLFVSCGAWLGVVQGDLHMLLHSLGLGLCLGCEVTSETPRFGFNLTLISIQWHPWLREPTNNVFGSHILPSQSCC